MSGTKAPGCIALLAGLLAAACPASANNLAVTNRANLNETNDGEWVACNDLSWADGCAYADWAALRPFTELEFEKACRGKDMPPVSNEYAWGDAVLETVTSALVNTNTATEAPNQGNCNCDGCSPAGPYRCGSYADASSSRAQAGAGYYGVLDLSGNLWEGSVTVGNATGRAFTGEHGDGALMAEGGANVTAWPPATGTGAGSRGGNYFHTSAYARVADRYRAADATFLSRIYYNGWRGARSAP